ncbi:MAG: PilZ domain-containing protein [Pseudolabrys sp.]|nr:PilZ domain-containing protein [Pseudolabrys sp.]
MLSRRHRQTVTQERRGLSRRVINRVAQYHCGLGALPRTCMVTDISDGGARLYSETDMPETFTLSITGDGADIRRECRVVWRLGGEVGVAFTDRQK